MQISSVGGRVGGSPGIASYQAAKFAIDGFSRVLRGALESHHSIVVDAVPIERL